MRCYFMRSGRIQGITFLKSGLDDARMVEEARSVFEHAGQQFDGFEVWEGTRFVYRSDVATTPSGTSGGSERRASTLARAGIDERRPSSLSLFLIDRLRARWVLHQGFAFQFVRILLRKTVHLQCARQGSSLVVSLGHGC